MKKLSYAIIASTGLIVAGFSPNIPAISLGFAIAFAVLALLADDLPRR